MAGESEKTTATAKKKPLSLNERHSLLISATQSKRPPSTTTSLFSLGLEDDDPSTANSPPVDRLRSKAPSDDFPEFSGIVDFDSPFAKSEGSDHAKNHAGDGNVEKCSEVADSGPSTAEFESSDHAKDHAGDGGVEKCSEIADSGPSTEKEELKKVKIQGRRRLCKVTAVQSCDQVQADGSGADECRETADDSGASTSLICTEKEKVEKVKIQGRRRLCKVASTSKDCEPMVNTEESFGGRDVLDISDFSSPQPTKNVVKNDGGVGGGNEIRDILNELSAKFDFLSIDKKRNLEPVEYKATQVEEDVGDYASAGSSFSKSSNSSSSSSDAHKGTDEMVAKGGLSELERGNFGGKALVDKKPAIPSKAFVHDVNDGEDSEDDCVVLESENVPRGKKGVPSWGKSRAMEVLDRDEGKEIASEHDDAITLKGPRSTYRLPGKIGKMLYPHQRDGLKWLWTLHCQGKGGILGDDMGLGKTMQICGFLVGLFHSKLTRRVIVVAPKTLIPHWIKELGFVGLSAKTREFIGTCPRTRQYELQYVLQDGGILLTTYDIVRNNWKQLCRGHSLGDEDDEEDPIWDYMILDEGHLIKNPSTQRAQSLLSVPCAHRIVISGTPIQNNLKELWALFHFCCPDLLGDKKWFKERYENPILRGNDKKATEREKRIGSTIAKELRDHIQPYFLRRLKSEVFSEESATGDVKLSKKNEVIVWLRLTSVQRRLYEAFLNSELVLSSFDGSPLAAITILKKICDHPYLLTKRAAEDVLDGMDSTLQGEDRDLAAKLAKHVAEFSGEDDFEEKHDNVSCKISFILSLLENLIPQGHNVLIFSQTRKMLNHIQESLISNGFQYQRIDGTTKACDRLSIVNDFQEGRGAPIFMLTSQVGGLGLTLTKADRVIVVDPAWNPSTDSQSVDRAYRIGQKKDVIVYRLMTCGTIEEKIYRMQIFKGGLFKTATEHKEQTRYFTKQDLKELFSLPKDGFDVSPTQQQLHKEHSHQIVMSDSLKAHMKFLESLGIGGVSHHSLLYSKTEPAPPPAQDEELARAREVTRTNTMYSSRLPKRRDDDGAEFANYAFNPRDARIQNLENKPSPDSLGKMTESQIIGKISRLSKLLSNKVTIARLPDGGYKIRKQLEGLNAELTNIRNPMNNEVIDLDDGLNDALNRSLKLW